MEIKRSPDVVRPVEVAKKAPKWPWVLGITLGSIIVLGLGVLGYVMYSQRMQPTPNQAANEPTNQPPVNAPTQPEGRTIAPTPTTEKLTKAVIALYNDPLDEDNPFSGPVTLSTFDLGSSRPKPVDVETLERQDLAVSVSGVVSPNGQFVGIFEAPGTGTGTDEENGHIWLVDLTDGSAQEIAQDPAFSGQLVWSPDSTTLVWSQLLRSVTKTSQAEGSEPTGDEVSTATGLVAYDVASGEMQEFAREDESEDSLGLAPLAWREDELFVRRGAPNTEDPGSIGVIKVGKSGDLDGKFSKLFDVPISARGWDISPDGRKIVLARGTGDTLGAASEGPYVIEVLDRDDGNALVELRRSPDEAYTAPLFTPDGEFLVYAALSGLWLYNLDDSGDRTQLVATDEVEEFVDSPELRPLSVQPDRSHLVFAAISDNVSRLLAVELDAEEAAADDLVELTDGNLIVQNFLGWTQ